MLRFANIVLNAAAGTTWLDIVINREIRQTRKDWRG